jgi:hypothetical protein
MKHLLFSLILAAAASSAAEKPVGFDLGALIQPVPATAILVDTNFNIWCGTMVRDDSGTCHLFYSRWPRQLGHHAWVTHSEIAHAVSDNPLGPYRHRDVVLPARGKEFWDGLCTHNPTVHRFGDKYYLYYMGNTGDGKATKELNWSHRNNQRIGVAVANSPYGPWKRFDKPLIDVSPDPKALDALAVNNPSITRRPDGGYLMIYKSIAKRNKLPFGGPVLHMVATSDSPTGPFKKYPEPVFTFPDSKFPAEDPFIWHDGDRYWAVVKDFHGNFTRRGVSLALFESTDGFAWKLASHPFVASPTSIVFGGRKLNTLERPQLWFDNGVPSVLFCAAADTPNRDLSFNIHIPLKRTKPVEAGAGTNPIKALTIPSTVAPPPESPR